MADPVGKYIPEFRKTKVAMLRAGGYDVVDAKRADHDPRPAHPHLRRELRRRPGQGPLAEGGHHRLVLRRPRRARGRHRQPHGRPADRRATRREVRVRLQDRHPRRGGREGLRASRSTSSCARASSSPSRCPTRSSTCRRPRPTAWPRSTPRGQGRQDRASAEGRDDGRARASTSRAAQDLLRRGRHRVDGARLRALPADDAERRRARRRAHPRPQDGRADDRPITSPEALEHKPGQGFGLGFSVLKDLGQRGSPAPSANTARAGPTTRPTGSIRRSRSWSSTSRSSCPNRRVGRSREAAGPRVPGRRRSAAALIRAADQNRNLTPNVGRNGTPSAGVSTSRGRSEVGSYSRVASIWETFFRRRALMVST